LLDKGKIERFYLEVNRIMGNFHFSIIQKETLGVNISSWGRRKSYFFGGSDLEKLPYLHNYLTNFSCA